MSCNASARSLAKLAAFMANKGKLNGTQILSESGWHPLHSNFTSAFMSGGPNIPTTLSQGGINIHDDLSLKKFDEFANHQKIYDSLSVSNNNRLGFLGWHGQGGVVMQWNVEHKIGFAYVPFD